MCFCSLNITYTIVQNKWKMIEQCKHCHFFVILTALLKHIIQCYKTAILVVFFFCKSQDFQAPAPKAKGKAKAKNQPKPKAACLTLDVVKKSKKELATCKASSCRACGVLASVSRPLNNNFNIWLNLAKCWSYDHMIIWSKFVSYRVIQSQIELNRVRWLVDGVR